MGVTRAKFNACPSCNRRIATAAAVFDGIVPEPGDVSICGHCRAVLEFADDLKLKLASVDTIAEKTLEISRAQNFLNRNKS